MMISGPCIPNVGADACPLCEELDGDNNERETDEREQGTSRDQWFCCMQVIPDLRVQFIECIQEQRPDDDQRVKMGPERKCGQDTEQCPV